MDLSPEFAEKCRHDALRKYEDEKEKFGLQMMMMGYFKIKSLLTVEGLEKVSLIDNKRKADEIFNKNFSEKMWDSTDKAWGVALGQLMIKISEAYGLTFGIDLRQECPDQDEDDLNLDFYV